MRHHKLGFSYITVLITCLLVSATTIAKSINLSSHELKPYIGKSLENQGALSEIAQSAFKSAEFLTHIEYFPALRAVIMAEQGEFDAVYPVLNDPAIAEYFLLSDPIPGLQLGLIARKGQWQKHSDYKGITIGVVRGTYAEAVKSHFEGAEFYYRNNNQQLLQMLKHERIDYVLIDKFTSADLLINQMPHLIGKLEFLHHTVIEKPFHLAAPKTGKQAAAIIETFNNGLQKALKTGTVDNILQRHGLNSFAKSGDKTTIRIATVDNDHMLTMKKLSSLYEQQNPHIELDWKVLDESVLRDRLLSDLAVSDGQYDVMTIGAYEAPIWAKNGWLLSLKDLPESYDVNDLITGVQKSLSYEGELHALPFYGESSMTFYRTDLFEQHGLTMPERPTWDQIAHFASTLHNPDSQIFGICLRGKPSWGENMALVTTIINTFGGQWFDKHKQPQLNTDAWRNALSFYVDTLQNYGPPGAEKNGYSENISLFTEGKCAMWVDATVAAGTLFDPKRSKVAKHLGFARAPIQITPKGSNWLWTWALAIPTSSTVQHEARKFIIWATSKQYTLAVAEDQGWLAVPPGTRHSTYQNPDYQSEVPFSGFVLSSIEQTDPFDATLKKSPFNGVQFVSIPEFPAIGNYVGEQISQVLSKRKSLHEALEDAQKFALNVMRESQYID